LRVSPFTRTLDESFREVVEACGDERPDARWIIAPYVEGFCRLHALGWAHSVEVWEPSGRSRTLVGGIYGVALGGFFAGESMFHRRTDASKIAFATLVHTLKDSGFELFDAQVMNPHLRSLGCIDVSRDVYLDRLDKAVAREPLRMSLAESLP
jgi:leucyl/phenylalanyl-tRNA--protein transferase